MHPSFSSEKPKCIHRFLRGKEGRPSCSLFPDSSTGLYLRGKKGSWRQKK